MLQVSQQTDPTSVATVQLLIENQKESKWKTLGNGNRFPLNRKLIDVIPHTLSTQIFAIVTEVTTQSNNTHHKHNPHMPASLQNKESQHQLKLPGLKNSLKVGKRFKIEGEKKTQLSQPQQANLE